MNRLALTRLKAWLKEYERVTEGDEDVVHAITGSFKTGGKRFRLRASDLRTLVEAIEGYPSPPPPYTTSIDELELSVRAANCLERAGVRTVWQLSCWSADDLLALSGFNEKCLEGVRAELRRLGLALRWETTRAS